MSSTNTDQTTSLIDNKKAEQDTGNSSEETVNYAEFMSGLLTYSISTLIIFGVIGSLGLYTCKVAQANVLPDNIDYAPFGTKHPKVETIPININVVKEYGFHGFGWMFGSKPKVMSTKIVFDGESVIKDYEQGGIGFINSFKTDPKRASYFGLYMRDVIFSIICKDNLITNTIYGKMNEFLSESAILILYPFLVGIIYFTLFFSNFCLSFFYQIKFWTDFFMDKQVKKDDVEWTKPFTYLRPIRSFVFFLYMIFLFFPMVFLLPIVLTLYSMFSPMGITGKTEENKSQVNFMNFMKDVLLFKSQLFLVILTFGLIMQSAKSLGTNGLIGSLVGTTIVFFILNLYNQYIPNDDPNVTPGLVSFEQAKKSISGGRSMKVGSIRSKNKHE